MQTRRASETTVFEDDCRPTRVVGRPPAVEPAEIDIEEVLDAFRAPPRPAGGTSPANFDPVVRRIGGRAARLVMTPCPVCDSERGEPVFKIAGLPQRLVRCLDCGTGRLWPLPPASEITRFYPAEYYGASGSKFRPLVERLVRMIAAARARRVAHELPAGARVLDVGCGRGVLLGALADRGCELHGFEISATAILGADSRTHIRIADNLAAACYPPDFFDQVILCHVLEHLPNPRETLIEVRRILKPDGRLVVSVPNFDSLQSRWTGSAWFHLDLPRHLYHFPLSALERLLDRCGFECRRVRHFALDQNVFGWVQSLLNRAAPKSRNRLYTALKSGPAQNGAAAWALSAWPLLAGAACAAPLAVALGLLEPALRRGGTVTVSAQKSRKVRDATAGRSSQRLWPALVRTPAPCGF